MISFLGPITISVKLHHLVKHKILFSKINIRVIQ
jgi:hypothetical protein